MASFHFTPTTIGKNLLMAAGFLSPWLFLPFFVDASGFAKLALGVLVSGVLLLLWSLATYLRGHVVISLTRFGILTMFLLLMGFLSAIQAPNPIAQLSQRFLILVILAVFTTFGVTLIPEFRWKNLRLALIFSTLPIILVTWWQIIPWSLTWLLAKAGIQVASGSNLSFFGSPFTTAVFLAVMSAVLIPMILTESLSSLQKKVYLGVLALSTLTAALLVFQMWKSPELRPLNLPYQLGWSLAVENVKTIRPLLVGVGPEQFLPAFHRAREVSINSTQLWNVRFVASSSELFQIITTYGFVAAAAWVALWLALFRAVMQLRKSEHVSLWIFVGFLAVWFVVYPFDVVHSLLFALVLLVVANEMRHVSSSFVRDMVLMLSAIRIVPAGSPVGPKTNNRVFAVVSSVVVGLLAVALLFCLGRLSLAAAYFQASVGAIQRNNGNQAYTWQQRAVILHPYWTPYRRAYSSTNLALAQALSGDKQQLDDQQKQLFSQLLQQAIREARLTGQLNPTETENWENLASLYSALLSVEGADQWATVANTQAIQTDPVSPLLRLRLGLLYRQLNQSEQALRLLEQAIQLKPDWNTALYHYGDTLLSQGNAPLATQVLERALQVTKKDDPDYAAIENKLTAARADKDSLNFKKEGSTDFSVPNQPTNPGEAPQSATPKEPIEQSSSFKNLINTATPSAEQPSPSNGNIVLPSAE